MEAAFDRLYEKVMVAGVEPQLGVEFRAAASQYFDSYIAVSTPQQRMTTFSMAFRRFGFTSVAPGGSI